MTLQYSLEIDSDSSPDDIKSMLAKLVAANGLGQDLIAEGIQFSISRQDHFRQRLLLTAYQISSRIYVLFNIDNDDSYETGIASMINIVVYMLNKQTCDAVFLANGETPLLLRRKLELYLAQHDFWTTEVRSKLPAHQLCPIPVL